MTAKYVFEELKEKGYTLQSAIKAGIVFEQWQWKFIVGGKK